MKKLFIAYIAILTNAYGNAETFSQCVAVPGPNNHSNSVEEVIVSTQEGHFSQITLKMVDGSTEVYHVDATQTYSSGPDLFLDARRGGLPFDESHDSDKITVSLYIPFRGSLSYGAHNERYRLSPCGFRADMSDMRFDSLDQENQTQPTYSPEWIEERKGVKSSFPPAQ